MEAVAGFLESHGYWLVFGLGFAEFIGVPIASVPVLVAAGGLAAAGSLSLPAAAGSAAAGALTADAVWYLLARWQGSPLLNVACGLSPNPNACVLSVSRKVGRLGAPYVLVAKFLPGAGNLIAPAAGLARMSLVRFVPIDALAVVLWATVYLAIGWVFSDQVVEVADWITARLQWAVGIGLLLIVGGGVWRTVKLRLHRHGRG